MLTNVTLLCNNQYVTMFASLCNNHYVTKKMMHYATGQHRVGHWLRLGLLTVWVWSGSGLLIHVGERPLLLIHIGEIPLLCIHAGERPL